MRFDWNPDKAEENKRKHEGVTFDETVDWKLTAIL